MGSGSKHQFLGNLSTKAHGTPQSWSPKNAPVGIGPKRIPRCKCGRPAMAGEDLCYSCGGGH